MMLNASELLVVLAIIFVVVGLQKLPQISRAVARARLGFQKGLAEDVVEVSVPDENGAEDVSAEARTESEQTRE
ncbi:hypothetical protein DL240_16810 [Lujinxingia litoralis]|uniref:Twin-arginine translocase TatA/TatE family subunit n=1 Tax=Lujinxingia litoralis TaxID=2211119 RepID=A0A328C3G6_9DELT|nr:twin-arginine translocase TatA/TatE family subunit [Lujinxingia litoralis]RAL20465.1 hypothetical protein DL240_16810 [Lujinxingia litoralis]